MKERFVQIESKNAVLEMLKEGRVVKRIFMARNAYKDPKTVEIMNIAQKKGINIEIVARRQLDHKLKGGSKESLIAWVEPLNRISLDQMLDNIYKSGDDPFILIFDDVKYAQNIGAIMRTGFAAYVNGVISPIKKDAFINDEIIRISMGACERIPMIEMNLFTAIKEMQDNGIKVCALDMEGEPYFDADLTGPVAFILGAEDTGVSNKIMERVDTRLSIPMKEGIGSLNVSASAAIVMFEKIRQEVFKNRAK